ncbi:reprolysin-like metallopeptidase [Hymenobacter arizonensis]|uniref:Por secretion system C-terminal sorting domain-containing protein n=1 Tax=Hymenobacter arizonensis TaxID=1227077 RepID=A0A1I6ARQ8_HYMAR|nr:zinc-dependent metalloprotease family protein [Hymenobacter arizonensis]SFQ71287.1 Por secretion system C-terminal sorting domain-containing protein [Hymenobacter arizonensis]
MKKSNTPKPVAPSSSERSTFRNGFGRLGACLLLALGFISGARAQQRGGAVLFQANAEARAAAVASTLASALFRSQALTLDVAAMRGTLATAPAEAQAGAAPLVFALPLPDGTTGRFALRQTAVMAPALAARFPEIKTYAGVGLDDPAASVRLDMTPQGFHAQVLTTAGNSFYVDPVSQTDMRHYLSFYRRDMNRAAVRVAPCGAVSKQPKSAVAKQPNTGTNGSARPSAPSGSVLRTYRLALACTPQYALVKGNTVASVLASEVSTVNRVVGVYEKELAVRMVLVPNNNQLVFLSGTGPQPNTPYTNNNANAMLAQNQTNLDAIIGTANYDIGHVFGTGEGGIAYQGSVCNATLKAGGVTGLPNPTGDAFDIDFVAHEMGHQFGGSHSFNGDADNCAGGNRNAPTAWEPGSGTTIMAYAGICGPSNNVQTASDAVFHTGSFQEMRTFIESTTCNTAANLPTGNTAPVVTAPASGRTLPIGTPFKLTATATDAENDPLTYSWEQMDTGPQSAPTAAQVPGQNVPLFRSFNPTASSTRYFPRLIDLVNNTTTLGERLPVVTRTMRFRCTARDEHSGPAGVIGGVDFSPFVNLAVTSTSGPFVVTAPNTAVSWTGGAAQTVTWDVAGTTNAPVSCALVNLRLSLDGGLTYPVLLAQNEPNDGSAVVIAPSPTSTQTQARVMVEAADNYFFDISNANFTITPPTVGPSISSFTPTGGLAGTVVTVLGSNFTGATAVSFNGVAATSFTVNSPTQLTATVAAGTTTGPITVTGPTGTATSTASFIVGPPPIISSFSPMAGPVGTSVIITGTNFSGATRVTFNGTNAPSFTVNSATQITATVPVNATTGPISIITPIATGVSATSFTVIPAPVVVSFTPASGAAGTVVVLTGNFFSDATQVTFNGTAAPTFTVNSATQITVTVPTGATTGLIAVTTPGGVSVSNTAFVVPPVNDLCANAIALTCGQTVTGNTEGVTDTGDPTGTCDEDIQGGGVFYTIVGTGTNITLTTCNAATGFDTMLFVYTGTCGSYTCVIGNDDSLPVCTDGTTTSTVTFPSVAGTVYRIFLTGFDNGLGSETGPFTLTATCTPTVTGLSPNSGPVGTVVTLSGTDLTGATALTLNGLPVTGFTVVNSTTITFTIPVGATTGNVVVTTPNGFTVGTAFTVTTATATANASKSEFSVWPNPVAGKGILNVRLTASTGKAQLTLRNVLGQTIATRSFSGNTTELSTAGLASGTYLLTVQIEGRAPSIQRVVVE